MTMFIAGGVLSTVLHASLLQWWSMGEMLFGPQGDFFVTVTGRWKKLETRLRSGSYNTFMV